MIYHDFYKFRFINDFSIDSLKNGYIYFPSPLQLNDPFDCRLDFGKILVKYAIKKTKKESLVLREYSKIEQTFIEMHKEINGMGICSFSTDYKESLMWSHYADNHKGICILYTFPEKFLRDEDNKNRIMGVAKVAYDLNPVTNWLNSLSKAKLNNKFVLFQEFSSLMLTQKSPAWKYEQEVRIVRHTKGPLKIDNSFIRKIYFGLQASDQDIETIKKITSKINKRIAFYKVVRGDDDFSINFVSI